MSLFGKEFFQAFGSFIPNQRKIGYYRRTIASPSASELTATFEIGRRRSVTEDDVKLHQIIEPTKTVMFSLWDSGEGVTPQPGDVLLDTMDGSRWTIQSCKIKIADNLFSISAEKEV